MISILKN